MTEWKRPSRLCEEVGNDLRSGGGREPHRLRERGLGFLVGRRAWGQASGMD